MLAEIPQKPDQTSIVKRATFGHWKIDGCPHHGAAIASGSGQGWQGYHMAYFDGNDKAPGLYYSRMDGATWIASSPQKFGDNAKQAGHPALLSKGESLWLAWRETKAGKTSILYMFSDDGGKSWSSAKTLKSTDQKTDYPILIQHKNQPYLVWNTQQERLQITPLQK
jgi:Neuraminidase (sialidase)